MKKFLTYSIILVILFGVLAPVGFIHASAYSDCVADPLLSPSDCKGLAGDPNSSAQITSDYIACMNNALSIKDSAQSKQAQSNCSNQAAQKTGPAPFSLTTITLAGATALLSPFLYIIMKLMTFILWLSGMLLDLVLQKTVTEMSSNISGLAGINIAWRVVRDVANIAFIFLLMFEGIKMILGISSKDNAQKIIGWIVLTALLINFSLFFTKVIIDASNVVTMGFYQSISAGGQSSTLITQGQTGALNRGMSGIFMNAVKIPGIFSGAIADGSLLVVTTMGSILFLIVSFIFIAISVMFIIRYFVLIVLMMLSPIGFLGFGLPQLKTYQDQWWETLKGQALFAPIFMFMTWITLTLITSPGFISTLGGADSASWGALFTSPTPPNSSIGLVVNFFMIIGLMMMNLVTSKSFSTKGAKIVGNIAGKVTAFAGGAVFGGAAAIGTNTAGRLGNRIANSESLKETAQKGGLTGALAKFTMKSGAKVSGSTFDMRNTPIISDELGAGKVNAKATFKDKLDAKIKEEEEFAKKLKPSDLEEAKAKAIVNSEEFKAGEEEKRKKYEKDLIDKFDKFTPPEKGTTKRVEFDNTPEGREYARYEIIKRVNDKNEKSQNDLGKSKQKVYEKSEEKERVEKDIETLNKELKTATGARKDEVEGLINSKKEEIKDIETLLTQEDKLQRTLNEGIKNTQKNDDEYDRYAKNWLSAEGEKIVAMSGGRKEDKGGKIDAVESMYSRRVNRYADNLEKHGRLKSWTKLGITLPFSAIGFGDPTSNYERKVIGNKLHKLTKEKTTDELLVESLKREKKAADDAKPAEEKKPDEPKTS